MSVQDMVQALKAAGFSGSSLLTMTSLGISESGGNAQALNNNPSTGDYSVGWFQINYFDGLYNTRAQKYGPPSYLLSNPQAQASAAWDLSGHGTNFSPWQGDYTNGKYYANLPAATAAIASVANVPVNSTNIGSGTTVGGASTQATLLSSSNAGNPCLLPINWPGAGPIGGGTTCLFYESWARALLGGILVGSGAFLILMGTLQLIRAQSNIPSPIILARQARNFIK